jgi:general L-amino acid transport system permease protein
MASEGAYSYIQTQPTPAMPPPGRTTGTVYWLRKNLFSSVSNTILTVVIGIFLLWMIPILYRFFIGDAVFTGTMEDCRVPDVGACWVFIAGRITFITYGFYPAEEYWRPNLVFFAGVLLVVPLLWPKAPFKGINVILFFVVYPVISFFLLTGGMFGLRAVPTELWGGLMVTLILAVVGVVGSIPIGILLALGRRSKLPIIKTFCILFIELWRAMPLITVLFMVSVMLPLFMSQGMSIDKLLRALVGVTVFYGAYMAEVVRGGLQALPRGQYEAASSLGLNYWKSMAFVILPQALKHVIPGIVGTLISLVKDTSLVAIIGIFDLLNAVQSAGSDTEWSSPTAPFTGYAFAILIFFAMCYSLSRYSLYMERRLNTGHKR